MGMMKDTCNIQQQKASLNQLQPTIQHLVNVMANPPCSMRIRWLILTGFWISGLPCLTNLRMRSLMFLSGQTLHHCYYVDIHCEAQNVQLTRKATQYHFYHFVKKEFLQSTNVCCLTSTLGTKHSNIN